MSADNNTKPKLVIGADAFGNSLRESLLPFLKDKGYEVEDAGVDKYYDVAVQVGKKVACSEGKSKGILLCGTGMGVGMVANKVPGIMSATVENKEAAANAKSVNNANVLALGAMITQPEAAKEIVNAWLATEFKGPSPANKEEEWPDEIKAFLNQSLPEIAQLERKLAAEEAQKEDGGSRTPCPLCVLTKDSDYKAVEGIPGATWVEVRQNPTRALVRFPKGAIEPAHHHTKGHDVFVTKGSKKVENITLGESFELKAGSYLYTAAGQQHRVIYHEDTEFIICSDGKFDVFWDEPFPETQA